MMQKLRINAWFIARELYHGVPKCWGYCSPTYRRISDSFGFYVSGNPGYCSPTYRRIEHRRTLRRLANPAVAAKSLRQVQYWLTPPRCSKFAPYTIGICSVCLALDSSRGGGRIRVGEAVSADWFSNAFLPHLISRQ
jgi:hypothetical protein